MTDINADGPLTGDLLDDNEAQSFAVVALLTTNPGERVYRPRYGTSFRQYLHRLATPETEALIRNEGILSVAANEPEIPLDVSESEVTRHPDGRGYDIDLRIDLQTVNVQIGV